MGTQIRVGQVDMSTGELVGAALAVVYPKRKNGFQTGWVAVAQDPMLELAKSDMGVEAWRVFAHLVGVLDFENWINLNQTAAAEQMGMKRPNYARGLRKLLEVGVVLPGPKVGRNATFRLNPQFGWKGSAKGHNEALAERMKARGMSVVKGGGQAPESPPPADADRDTLTIDLFDPPTP
jgi:hypothetical protein